MQIKKINYEECKEEFDRSSVISCSTEYINFVREYWQAKPEFLGLFDGDKLQAVLTLFSRQEKNFNILEGAVKSYTEILYLDDVQVDLDEIIEFIKNNFKFDILELSICRVIGGKKIITKRTSQNTFAYALDASDINDVDKLLNSKIDKKTRNQIKKSYEYGLNKEISADIEKFYPLYKDSIKRFNAKPKQKKYFYDLKNAFGQNFYILFCEKDGQAVGANLFIVHNRYLSLFFSVSLKNYWKYYVNNFIYWEMIKLGMEKGTRWFDFGINAKRDEAQIHFKKGFGALAFPIEHLVILNSIKSFLSVYWKKFRFLIKLMFKI